MNFGTQKLGGKVSKGKKIAPRKGFQKLARLVPKNPPPPPQPQKKPPTKTREDNNKKKND